MASNCVYCNKKIDKVVIECKDVPNEGYSTIFNGEYYFDIENKSYCSINCFLTDLYSQLHINTKYSWGEKEKE